MMICWLTQGIKDWIGYTQIRSETELRRLGWKIGLIRKEIGRMGEKDEELKDKVGIGLKMGSKRKKRGLKSYHAVRVPHASHILNIKAYI